MLQVVSNWTINYVAQNGDGHRHIGEKHVNRVMLVKLTITMTSPKWRLDKTNDSSQKNHYEEETSGEESTKNAVRQFISLLYRSCFVDTTITASPTNRR